MSIEKNNLDDKISLSFLITGLKDWISFLIAKKNHIVLVSCSILFFTISHNYLLNPTHYARTTFVLDNDSTSSMGDLSSLASLAGVNASSFKLSVTLALEGSMICQNTNEKFMEKKRLLVVNYVQKNLAEDHTWKYILKLSIMVTDPSNVKNVSIAQQINGC